MVSASNDGQAELNLSNGARAKFGKPLKKYYDHLLVRHGVKEKNTVLSDNAHYSVLSFHDFVYDCPDDYKPKPGKFKMIVQSELGRITKLIRKGPDPLTTMTVWNLCMAHADWESGIVLLSRKELAKEASVHPPNVSKAIKHLEELGAVFSYREGNRTMYQCAYDVGWAGKSMSETQRKALYMKDRLAKLKAEGKLEPELRAVN